MEINKIISNQTKAIEMSKNERWLLLKFFFIDGGSEPGKSGGTGIYKDADFEKPLLVPHCLENSVLIYNSKNDFYHGFDVMSKDTFRHAITFQFIQE